MNQPSLPAGPVNIMNAGVKNIEHASKSSVQAENGKSNKIRIARESTIE